MIEKERIEKDFSGDEPDIDNIFPSINKPCEEVLKEIYVSETEQDCSSTKKKNEDLIEKRQRGNPQRIRVSYDTPCKHS